MSRIRTISILCALTHSSAASLSPKITSRRRSPRSAETTTATFGAWTLRCERRAESLKVRSSAKSRESVVPKDQQNPIAHIGIVHPLDTEKGVLRVNVIFPPNIFIPTAPSIHAKDGDLACHSSGSGASPVAASPKRRSPPAEIKAWRAVERDTGPHYIHRSGRPQSRRPNSRCAVLRRALDALEKVKS